MPETLSMKPLVALLTFPLLAAAAPPPHAAIEGTWRNPMGTVEVHIGTCTSGLCGTVVSASPAAVTDARDSGYPGLIGMELMHDYHAAGRGRWQGTIFVPDIGRSFPSHIELVGGDQVRVSGCLVGQFLCKSQIWRRA